MNTQFLVGTSGWTYAHWKGVFYPEGLSQSHWFEHYATIFPAVEVNATFYRTFADQTYANWRQRAPDGFTYILKVPRTITHRKFLAGAEDEIRAFWRSSRLLEEKLGLLLLQVAPATGVNPKLLRHALDAFEDPSRVAVEFRRSEWLNEDTLAVLRESGSTLVSVDAPGLQPVDWLTSRTGYIRLHGRSRWYAHDYSPAELEQIASIVLRMSARGAERVFIFFNNDFEGHAPKNARELMSLLRKTQPD